MTSNQIVQFLQCLHAKNIKPSTDWVMASCPLARFLHTNHVDSNPSFGIKIEDSGSSYYNCFACSKGSMEQLLQTFCLHQKNLTGYNIAVCHTLLEEELKISPLPEYQEVPVGEQVFEEFPAYVLDSFKPAQFIAEALAYVEGRGYGVEEIVKYDIRYDSARKMIVFPYKNVYGKFAGMRGRSISNDVPKRHHDYSYNGRNNAGITWYQEENLNLSGSCVVVEGQLDCIKTLKAYPKVVSNMMALPVWAKMKKLSDSGTVIQIADSDETGERSIDAYRKCCKKLGIRYKVIKLKSESGEKLDPDMCHVDYLKEQIHAIL